jgi:hypothetical protein
MDEQTASDLLQEILRRKRVKALERYKPHPYQVDFHNAVNDHNISMMYGGNGIGKTLMLLAELIAMVKGYRPWTKDHQKTFRTPPVEVALVGPNFTIYHSKKSIPTLLSLAPLETWARTEKNNNGVYTAFHDPNGSVLSLMSVEQAERQSESMQSPFEGIDWDAVALDEPFPKQNVFVPIQRGVMKKDGRIMIGLTPLAQRWIFDELFEPGKEDPDIWTKTVRIWDAVKSESNPNGHIDEHALQVFWNTIKGSDEEEARMEGRPTHRSGIIFKDFDPIVHSFDEDLPNAVAS